MKRKLLLSCLVASSFTFSQIENIHRCGSTQAIAYQESLTPGYAESVNQAFEAAKAVNINPEGKSGAIYTIPVVFHVVHNIPEENVPDSVILDQLRILNEDYGRMNADTVNMRSDFNIVKGNPKIEFKLAQIDPLGNPTTGITRTNTTLESFGSLLFLQGDMSDLERVKSSANGGIDPWDQSRYLNVWVCDMSIFGFTALLGYATPPAGLPNWPPGSTAGMSDGVVLQYQTVGSNNPVDLGAGFEVLGRTATHEIGHYLGLRHIWGDGDCTAQDGIDDTPNADAQSDTDCDPLKNTCVDNIQGIDLPDMIENYMDYSSEDCQNTFTAQQVSLIHGVLELQRYDLVHNNPANQEELKLALSIYPNPAQHSIQIQNHEKFSSFVVKELNGKDVIHQDSSQLVDISGLNPGMYFLEATTSTGEYTAVRFVKN